MHIVWDLHKVLDIGTSLCASSRYRYRDAVFKNKMSFTSFNTIPTNNYKIFVNEALTRRMALLFKKAQAAVKTGQASFC